MKIRMQNKYWLGLILITSIGAGCSSTPQVQFNQTVDGDADLSTSESISVSMPTSTENKEIFVTTTIEKETTSPTLDTSTITIDATAARAASIRLRMTDEERYWHDHAIERMRETIVKVFPDRVISPVQMNALVNLHIVVVEDRKGKPTAADDKFYKSILGVTYAELINILLAPNDINFNAPNIPAQREAFLIEYHEREKYRTHE